MVKHTPNTAPRVMTFGCRLNAYESSVINALATKAGFDQQTTIINTCAVTAEAVRKARNAVRKAQHKSPNTRIIVTGCASEVARQSFADMGVTTIGNDAKMHAHTWARLAKNTALPPAPVDIMHVNTLAHPNGAIIPQARARAVVAVQNGCNHRCTFCIIPYARGQSRSLPIAKAISQVRALVEQGHKEIVLTGVDLTAWGRDLDDRLRLGHLVQAILDKVPALQRLRLSSLDSIEMDAALLAAFAEQTRLMPFVHLSLQSGDDLILKRMKRRHNRQQSIAMCQQLKQNRPDITFGADLIAGFPTETDQAFANSVSLIDACGLTWVHVFPFSPRPGTPAARMPQLPHSIIQQRAMTLREITAQRIDAHLQQQHGKDHRVLIETPHFGRSEDYSGVDFDQQQIPGHVITVRAHQHRGNRLHIS